MTVAFVTGGSKGIGLETVKRLNAQGMKVITCSRNPDVWAHVVETYPELASVEYMPLDIKNERLLKEAFDYVEKKYGKLDVAVNNASPSLASGGSFVQVSVEDLRSTLDNDFWAHALCLKYQLNLMRSGSCIVNISSVNGLRPTPSAAMYSASKHAIEGLTRSIAVDAIKMGIRVNSVAPGVTWTPRWEEKQQTEPNIKEQVCKVVPANRFAEVDEVVEAIMFLLSDKARYIVGHTLVVDGGLSLT
ncbi:SDR family NAD(P)-dependent oxidoreductase [Vibrio marisflavi]|uniref:2,5-dichloro-2,5-cyclohexadiene-1,4-diol dehydrogenase n=1 Tax=Vibrio marisflavi CECT 7928 TaxID=634439 RepID=A0ABM8ZZE6_9VIBR|nr:SDR family oxidoreductase [Vibrio marisflavi]CAH0536439.1 2,5-dichloro-2,5-cyclohexadiene-1,4-diol dehydrogenase [Vibrio marisflavi CECT 7928]